MNPWRKKELDRALSADKPFDVLIIGGGATGLGVAWDAATRGFSTLVVERGDFASGTSSRSTKLIHGGVRYLRQGNLSLVRESLRERGLLLRNAAGHVNWREFVIPVAGWLDKAFYGAGLKAYDLLAGGNEGRASSWLNREETLSRIPGLRADGVVGGVSYHDGQFDDAELALALVEVIREAGGAALNHVDCVGLVKENGRVRGVRLRDGIDGLEFELKARVVVNAAGVFGDGLRNLDRPGCVKLITASRGSHLVLPRDRLGGESALMVPKTSDGRVLFAIPWHDRVLLGTTDVATEAIEAEPVPDEAEIEFMLEHANRYLEGRTERKEVLSMFAGLRPLVASGKGGGTSALSREHVIETSLSGLISVAGGKWTTFRRMAEMVVNRAIIVGGFESVPCRTEALRLHPLRRRTGDPLHPALPITRDDVERAVREQMAERLEDVLSRRTRCLLLDARASGEVAPEVAALMADLAGHNKAWLERELDDYGRLVTASLP